MTEPHHAIDNAPKSALLREHVLPSLHARANVGDGVVTAERRHVLDNQRGNSRRGAIFVFGIDDGPAIDLRHGLMGRPTGRAVPRHFAIRKLKAAPRSSGRRFAATPGSLALMR